MLSAASLLFTIGIVLDTIPFAHAAAIRSQKGLNSESAASPIVFLRSEVASTTYTHADIRAISIALILFILFCALLFVAFLYGKAIRSRISGLLHSRRTGTPSTEEEEEEEETGPGFGFDGLSELELKALRKKEAWSMRGGSSFTRLPAKPPSLRLSHTAPLPPLTIAHCQSKAMSQESDDGI